MNHCRYIAKNGDECTKPCVGVVCKKHLRYAKEVKQALLEENSARNQLINEVLGVVLAQPALQGIFGKITGVIDQAGSTIEKITQGDYSFFQRPASPPPSEPKIDPRQILGFPPDATLTREKIKARKKELAIVFHPDKGYDPRMMQQINDACEVLLKEIKK